jgi:ankyrin repeat protein
MLNLTIQSCLGNIFKLSFYFYGPIALQDGTTALLLAAQNGHREVARLLLESKADITTSVNQVLITSS